MEKVDLLVSLNMLCTPKPNGFHDHYPYNKWIQMAISLEILTRHFQTNPFAGERISECDWGKSTFKGESMTLTGDVMTII